jgi:hypothetical protein
VIAVPLELSRKPKKVAALGHVSYASRVSRRSSAVLVLPLVFVLSLLLAACERKTTPSSEPASVAPLASSAPARAPAPREGPPGAVVRGAGSAEAPSDATRQFAKVEFPEVPIRAGATTTVKVAWKSPPGTGVNEEAPFRVRWDRSDALAEAPSDVKATGTSARDGFRIAVKPLDGAPNATLGGVIDLVVCDMATHSVCVPVRRKVEIEFVVGKSASAETTVTVDLPQAKAK